MILAAMGKKVMSNLLFVEGNLDAQPYTTILTENFCNLLKTTIVVNTIKPFSTGNASSRHEDHTKGWFIENAIALFEWLANPVESIVV